MRYIATAAKCFAEDDTMSLKQLFVAVAAAHSSAAHTRASWYCPKVALTL